MKSLTKKIMENQGLQPNSLEFLQKVINTTSDPIFVKDEQHRWILFNDAFGNFIGVNREELLGKSDYDFFPKAEADIFWEKDRLVLELGIDDENEEQITRKGGNIHTISTKKSCFKDEQGNKYIVGIIRDITNRKLLEETLKQIVEELEYRVEERTVNLQEAIAQLELEVAERKQAEAKIKESFNLINAVVEGTSDMIFVKDSQGNYVLANSAFIHSVGKTKSEIIGSNDTMLFPPEVAQQVMAIERLVIASGNSLTFEQILPLSGELKTFLMTKNPYRNAEGKIIGLIAIARDITERKLAEGKQRESQELLRLVMDNIPQLIFWKDCNSVYQGCNYNFARAAGVGEPRNIVGKTDYDLPWTKEESDWYRECDRRVIENNTAEYHILETQKQADGKETWADTCKIPLHDAQGNVIGVLGTYEDVTERKQVEALLQEKNQRLEQALSELQQAQTHLIQSEKMSSLGQLVAGVAHEINNPVNFIHGNLVHANQYMNDLLYLLQLYQDHCPCSHPDLIEKEEEIDLEFLRTDLPKLLSSMQVGADRIRAIVQSLRHFSRIDEAEVKDVDIHEGIESTLMILSNRLKVKPDRPAIEVIKQYGKLPLVECYAGQLNQVFMNIISNAIDALEERIKQETGHQPKIWINTDFVEPNRVKIRIADNALGMAETVREHLFDAFFTTKSIGKGTGLGMSISYQIVTGKHGGTLDCNSTFGEGTEFIVEIPIQRKL
jgi:PAS domain S-box-containing protein